MRRQPGFQRDQLLKMALFCQTCNIGVSSEITMRDHVKGRRHQQAVAAVEKRKAAARCSLYCRDFPPSTTEVILRQYFAQFGNISRIMLEKQRGCYCILHFDNEASVQRALSHTNHRLGGHRLTVRPRKPITTTPGHGARSDYRSSNQKVKGAIMEEEEAVNQAEHEQLMRNLLQMNSVFDQMEHLYQRLCLSEQEECKRREVCEYLHHTLLPFFPTCTLHQFGSSVNGFGMRGCDMDLFVDFHDDEISLETEEHMRQQFRPVELPYVRDIRSVNTSTGPLLPSQLRAMLLMDRARLLSRILTYHGHGCGDVTYIPSARCPIARFVHIPTGIKCDMSVNNRLGLRNTKLLRMCGEDRRVRLLVFAVRYWGKWRQVAGNVASGPRLSNYCLSLLAYYYLANTHPPVLPTVQQMVEMAGPEEQCFIEGWNCSLPALLGPTHNIQTADELLRGFFQFFSNIDLSSNVLMMRTATQLSLQQLLANRELDPVLKDLKVKAMAVQDPFVLSHNITLNVNGRTKDLLSHEIQVAMHKISGWTERGDPASDSSSLWGLPLLFSSQGCQLPSSPTPLTTTVTTVTPTLEPAGHHLTALPRSAHQTCVLSLDLSTVSPQVLCALHARGDYRAAWYGQVCKLLLITLREIFLFSVQTEISISHDDNTSDQLAEKSPELARHRSEAAGSQSGLECQTSASEWRFLQQEWPAAETAGSQPRLHTQTDGQRLGDQTDGQRLGDQTDGQRLGDQTDGQRLGDQTDGQRLGDQTDGQRLGDQTDGPSASSTEEDGIDRGHSGLVGLDVSTASAGRGLKFCSLRPHRQTHGPSRQSQAVNYHSRGLSRYSHEVNRHSRGLNGQSQGANQESAMASSACWLPQCSHNSQPAQPDDVLELSAEASQSHQHTAHLTPGPDVSPARSLNPHESRQLTMGPRGNPGFLPNSSLEQISVSCMVDNSAATCIPLASSPRSLKTDSSQNSPRPDHPSSSPSSSASPGSRSAGSRSPESRSAVANVHRSPDNKAKRYRGASDCVSAFSGSKRICCGDGVERGRRYANDLVRSGSSDPSSQGQCSQPAQRNPHRNSALRSPKNTRFPQTSALEASPTLVCVSSAVGTPTMETGCGLHQMLNAAVADSSSQSFSPLIAPLDVLSLRRDTSTKTLPFRRCQSIGESKPTVSSPASVTQHCESIGESKPTVSSPASVTQHSEMSGLLPASSMAPLNFSAEAERFGGALGETVSSPVTTTNAGLSLVAVCTSIAPVWNEGLFLSTQKFQAGQLAFAVQTPALTVSTSSVEMSLDEEGPTTSGAHAENSLSSPVTSGNSTCNPDKFRPVLLKCQGHCRTWSGRKALRQQLLSLGYMDDLDLEKVVSQKVHKRDAGSNLEPIIFRCELSMVPDPIKVEAEVTLESCTPLKEFQVFLTFFKSFFPKIVARNLAT